ncbi:MAG: cysteine synthase A [Akkermansia sp.]
MTADTSESIIDTVGNTPLIKLNHLTEGLEATVLVKCEFRNPLFSIKDRVARAMIREAEQSGQLQSGGIIIEPTSGNTGISLAALAGSLGYKCILVLPETMSLERKTLLRLLGADIVLTPGALGMKGAISKSLELLEKYAERAYSPQQFENPANPETHYQTTGPEIYAATQGKIDAFIAGVGTGGTISGTGRYLKEHGLTKIIAVEPAASPVLSGGTPGPHKIQGIGAGFIPKNLNLEILDEIITVTDEDAIQTAQALAEREGIPAGISSGANVWAALQLAKRPEFAGKTIVTVAASATERYLSTPLADKAREEVAAIKVSKVSIPNIH